ncbi:hypothetical protein K4749_39900 [Streptomyces sp. TRM72054]|uniref:hypothetical protein n=1 Tax=Streptomyces sp. TRM72054 TaxID=2870562 RepID=UPI001C8CDFF3|nr:hypothetical protein [Streptomyces sp. TRM72054]MBX9399534.1 hypothetical protein [Streptomyces sp. TRM72054]
MDCTIDDYALDEPAQDLTLEELLVEQEMILELAENKNALREFFEPQMGGCKP